MAEEKRILEDSRRLQRICFRKRGELSCAVSKKCLGANLTPPG